MGILLGLIASATFGLIPFFALPLMRAGMPIEAVLFYRFFWAAVTLGLLLIVRRERLHVPMRDLWKLAAMSFMYTMSALLLFWGFAYASSGVATTIHFLYPVLVMLIMTSFFHEKFSWLTMAAVILAVGGVALLSNGGSELPLQTVGLVILVASALANAVYISAIHVSRLNYLSGLSLTFYVMAFSAFYTFVNAQFTGTFQTISSGSELVQLLMLSLVTAVLSNLTLILAVKRIGSTLTSVLGAMEPMTAVCVGIIVFHEPFTLHIMGGVVLIVTAMLSVMLGPQLLAFSKRWRRTP